MADGQVEVVRWAGAAETSEVRGSGEVSLGRLHLT